MAHEQRGVAIDPQLVIATSFLADAAFGITSSLLSARRTPTAIIAAGIDMLSGVLKAIRVKGFDIPRDISVVAAGDSSLAELYSPPISVERWDQSEVGRAAARLLLDRIAGRSGSDPRRVILPTEFVYRQSTAPPREERARRAR